MNEPQTVRVRIAVAVNERGDWASRGDRVLPEEDAIRYCVGAVNGGQSTDPVSVRIVEANVPLPLAPQIVEGEVVPAEEG